MISFRDCVDEVSTRDQLQHVRNAVQAGDAEGVLIEAGALEQAVLDALHTESDGWGPLGQNLRRGMLTAGAAFVARQEGRPFDGLLDQTYALLERLGLERTVPSVRLKAPEGYIHYALDPAAYLAAARTYQQEVGVEHAAKAIVVGVRTIGTSLSAAVAAALGTERSITVRPFGESGTRRVEADASLFAELTRWLTGGGDVLVVDEGPGATGETFFCIGAWLNGLGVPDTRIVLLPSHEGGMGLAPAERVSWFSRVRKYPPPWGDARADHVMQVYGLAEPEDLSGGRWRGLLPGSDDVPTVGSHERRKYRAVGARGDLVMLRYAGVGHWGTAALKRAEILSERGVGPRLVGAERGYMIYEWVHGHPVRNDAAIDPSFRGALSTYLALRTSLFRINQAVDKDRIRLALVENAKEALGPDPSGLKHVLHRLERLPEREAVIPDARLQTWEWIAAPRSYVKVDAFDHGDGLRLPGPCDPAWDLAGAAVEYGLDDAFVAELVSACAGSPADCGELARAVAAYRAAYAACCLGAADISMRETYDAEDRCRLGRDVERYRLALRTELERAASQ